MTAAAVVIINFPITISLKLHSIPSEPFSFATHFLGKADSERRALEWETKSKQLHAELSELSAQQDSSMRESSTHAKLIVDLQRDVQLLQEERDRYCRLSNTQ